MRLAGDVSSKSHRRGEPYPLRSKHSRGMAPRSVSSDGIVEIIDLTDIPHSPVKEDDSVPPKLKVPSNTTTECPSTAEAAKQEDVYTFLDTCQPPMLQYTQQFMDFGCTSNKYLRAVSLWRKEQRYNLVRKIMQSSRATESEPTEMDIAILVNQFETYFLEN
ncbi:hypothetical protein BDN70DRAFT_656686 [Pholiota conissans]|uniref:Uncharacterized protein n=1 Tax=Pholiota conissans TaxID=109636 RepID=A0A9P5Z242_9AGAR|nr:hypothetical protein BDN70DRAFT_656686 [Pholiota conissans]